MSTKIFGQDPFRGRVCEVKNSKHEWEVAGFVTVDLVGFEPIVQVRKSMPIYATWGTVRGLPARSIIEYYRAMDKEREET